MGGGKQGTRLLCYRSLEQPSTPAISASIPCGFELPSLNAHQGAQTLAMAMAMLENEVPDSLEADSDEDEDAGALLSLGDDLGG